MLTEYSYQIARVHCELVGEWKQKNRNYLAERVISSLIFGLGLGFGSVLSLQILLFSIDLPNLNWLMVSLVLGMFLSIGMFISDHSAKPSIHDAKFIVSARND